MIKETPLKYEDAEEYCIAKGTSLASLHSLSDYHSARIMTASYATFVSDAKGVWFGLNDFDNDGTWTYDDNTTADYGFDNGVPDQDYLPWVENEPDGTGNCVAFMWQFSDPSRGTYTPGWYDEQCNISQAVLCNKIIDPIYECLNTGHSIHAWYDGDSFEMGYNLWRDKTGNNNNGKVVNDTEVGVFDGSIINHELYLNSKRIVYGGTSTKIKFNVELNPENHTVFNIAKYREFSGASKQRIIQTNTESGVFGFWHGKSGVAWENYWITDYNTDNFGDEWVFSTQQNDLYRGNRIDLTSNASYISTFATFEELTINQGPVPGQESDFAIAELVVINNKLDIIEIKCVENYLHTKYYGSGCSDSFNSRVVISNAVYACPGTIKSGGVYGSDAETLCGEDYHVCDGSLELQSLGMNQSMCDNEVAYNDNEFFATKETSSDFDKCYSDYGGDGRARNDIWGCSKSTSGLAISQCGVLNSRYSGPNNWNNWHYGGDAQLEASQAILMDSSSGGVLCCIGSYVHFSFDLCICDYKCVINYSSYSSSNH